MKTAYISYESIQETKGGIGIDSFLTAQELRKAGFDLEKTVHSHNDYQMKAYVFTQEEENDKTI